MSLPDSLSAPQPSRRQALIEKLRNRLIGPRGVEGEPIAIVGMACRFPGGVDSPEKYWELLRDGVNAVTEVPADRWDVERFYDQDPEAAGKACSRWGGFLPRVDWFDAGFFGIAPSEISRMDPQQRLVLEVAWEALENAGIVPKALSKSATGVYIGASFSDYGFLQLSNVAAINAYSGLGTGLCIIANRLSYLLDLRGPSMAIDTACSSSLVAVHLACRALRSRECDFAVAGGVNVILAPAVTVGMSKLNALSPDGQCKTFDARANGYVRGEGCGIVMLKRLSDALAAGDPIVALIRGSAVQNDGHSNGITAPNGPAQESLLRAALSNAGVDASHISYIEAHGTGTALGDPIEVEALIRVYGASREESLPCLIGSVKTNFGHLEAAAGIAGLMKTVLCLRNRAIAPTVHFRSLNPHISLDGTRLQIASAHQPWPARDVPFLAAVSSFGFGGTIAHVVLEETPRADGASSGVISIRAGSRRLGPRVLPLSARHPDALRTLAETVRDGLSRGNLGLEDLGDVCSTASVRRTHHEVRLAVVGHTPRGIADGLDTFLRGERQLGVVHGHCRTDVPRRIVFVFSGQGSQWIGMGRQLLREELVFREALNACDEAVQHHAGWSVADELQTSEQYSRLNQLDIVQPCVFAIQVAIAAQWRALGVEPTAVIGHSMGEIAAAHVAGALDVEDAARVVCRRSRIARDHISGKGGMAVVELSMEDAQRAIAGYLDRLSLAVSNGPTSTVLSGDVEALGAVLQALESKGVFCRRINVDYASHSPHVDPLKPLLLAELRPVFPQPPKIPFYSTVTGTRLSGTELDAKYWVRNLREPVQFWPTLRLLVEEGIHTFVEISPHPVLATAVQEGMRHLGVVDGGCVGSLRRDQDERISLLSSLGELYTLGYPIDFRFLYPEGKHRVVRLPNYPWQRQRYWLPKPPAASSNHITGAARPFLGERLHSPALKARVYEAIFTSDSPVLLSHHRLGERVMVPMAAWIDAAFTALSHLRPGPVLLETGSMARPLTLLGEAAARVQCILQEKDGRFHFQAVSQPVNSADPDQWALRMESIFRPLASEQQQVDRHTLEQQCRNEIDVDAFFSALGSGGVGLGPSFRCVSSIRVGTGEALARVQTPPRANAAFQLHPALLEIGFRILGFVGAEPRAAGAHFMPVAVEALALHCVPPDEGHLFCHAKLLQRSEHALEGSITLFDYQGRIVACAARVRIGPIPKDLRPKAELKRSPRETFDTLPPEKRAGWMEAFLTERLARLIGIAQGAIDKRRSLRDFGTDSLLALEIVREIERDLGVRVPVANLIAGASLLDLAKVMLELLGAGRDPNMLSMPPKAGLPKGAGLVLFTSNRAARLRLFCLPFSAGGANAFRNWHRHLPDHVEIRALRPPGREDRLEDPAHTKMGALLDEAVAHLRPLLDRPFALYGHSLGGTVAFELVRRLRAEALPLPFHLFVGAAQAPHLPRQENLAGLPDEVLGDYLQLLEGTPQSVLLDPEMRRIALRILRADLAVLDSYQYHDEPPLPCPITLFAGQDDPLVELAAVEPWRQHTAAALTIRIVPGGHFFLYSHMDELLERLGNVLNFPSVRGSAVSQYPAAERQRDSVPAPGA